MEPISNFSSNVDIKQLIVSKDIVGMRCDRWLQYNYPNAPKGLIHKWLRTGQMRVDGKRCKASQRLLPDQKIRIPFPAKYFKQEEKPADLYGQKENGILLNSFISWYNDFVIAINKPFGLAVQGGTNIKISLVDIISNFSTLEIKDSDYLSSSTIERLYLIHRLDKETSGAMIIARKHSSALMLTELFRLRKVDKSYCAIIKGEISPKNGKMTTDIKQYIDNGQQSVSIHKAISEYKTISTGTLNDNSICSLVLLKPKSGRKHQLRIHCRDAGHPILGDFKINPKLRYNNNGISRLMLHSLAIEVKDKDSEYEFKHFVSPETEFLEILTKLKIKFPSKANWLKYI